MFVRESVVYCHVTEIPLEEPIEEIFDYSEIEARINEYCADVSFQHIRQALIQNRRVKIGPKN